MTSKQRHANVDVTSSSTLIQRCFKVVCLLGSVLNCLEGLLTFVNDQKRRLNLHIWITTVSGALSSWSLGMPNLFNKNIIYCSCIVI